MSRASGAGCAADAFANGPGTELLRWGQNVPKIFEKSTCIFSTTPLYYASTVFWLIGQAVKTSPSHGENRGSIPLGTAKKAVLLENKAAFFFAPQENICFGV